MAESRFIKTVVFGGYDKADVDKRLEYLYTQYYDMKNELRETKLMLAKLRDGADEKAAQDSVLANERAKLTEFQVKNETISEKLKSTDEDNKAKEKEIADLKEKLKIAEDALADANTKLRGAEGGGDAAVLGVVFAEAQKSANMIIAQASKQAEDLKADSEKLAANAVAEANNKAAKIIYDAEVRAAKLTADAENKNSEMEVASENMKAAMLNDVTKIGNEIAKLKNLFDDFSNTAVKMAADAQDLVDSTSRELKAGGVPVFRQPGTVEPKLPEAPKYEEVDNTYNTGISEEDKKKSEDLEKLKAMAASINNSGKKPEAKAEEKPAEEAPKKSGGLDDILKKAKAIK
ncbi:MAG: plectin [Ruminococcus sp.]|nr:plectin [Ruminococcus sp.]